MQRVWIVTPSFRSLQWLPCAVASVADQVGEGIEIHHHIQDGGSDDGTREWLEHHAAECARSPKPGYSFSYESARDCGMYEALNIGWGKVPQGFTLIGHLNSDEQYLPGALLKITEIMERNPTWEVVLADMIVVDGNGDYVCHRRCLKPMKIVWRHTTGGMTAATFQRVSVVRERGILFNSDWRIIADLLWYNKLMHAGCVIGYCNQMVSVFSETGSNLGWSQAVLEEIKRYADMFLGGKICLINFFRKINGLRRLTKEWFHRAPRSYAIYTMQNQRQRRTYAVDKPTSSWAKTCDGTRPPNSSGSFG